MSVIGSINFGMDSMDFFNMKCLDCLRYVVDVHWTSEWKKDAFDAFKGECVRLGLQLETAKLTEDGLNEWKKALFDAHTKLKVACEPYAPNAVWGTDDDYKRLEGINRTLNTCRDVIKEMLRILNPSEEKYKVWYVQQDRERFLKDIGFLKGIVQPTGDIQTLLGQMKKLYA